MKQRYLTGHLIFGKSGKRIFDRLILLNIFDNGKKLIFDMGFEEAKTLATKTGKFRFAPFNVFSTKHDRQMARFIVTEEQLKKRYSPLCKS